MVILKGIPWALNKFTAGRIRPPNYEDREDWGFPSGGLAPQWAYVSNNNHVVTNTNFALVKSSLGATSNSGLQMRTHSTFPDTRVRRSRSPLPLTRSRTSTLTRPSLLILFTRLLRNGRVGSNRRLSRPLVSIPSLCIIPLRILWKSGKYR